MLLTWVICTYIFFLSESNLITEGDNSEDFFIHTLPSSPPLDLKCETTFDSLNLTWTFPFTGMFEQSNDVSYYYFKYELIESKLKKSTLSSNNFWLGNYVKGKTKWPHCLDWNTNELKFWFKKSYFWHTKFH